MKRTAIKRRKTPRLKDYEAEFEAQRPLVHARSKGRCESARIALQYIAMQELDEKQREILTAIIRDEILPNCKGRAVHVHHRKYRGLSRGGTNALDNLADLCRWCHDWTHSRPSLSGRLGLSLKAHESEELR